MFAIDTFLCITVSQLFACVLVPCVLNWCEETDCDLPWGDHVQWSSPDMVDEIYDTYWICMGSTHCATLGTTAEFWNKRTHQKGVMSAPQKSKNNKSISNHNASCCPVTDVFFVKRLESQGNNMLKTLVKCMTKTSEDSVNEAVTRKQDQHILLKVQDTDLSAREAHYHATCCRDYTRKDDRHQETITKTI